MLENPEVKKDLKRVLHKKHKTEVSETIMSITGIPERFWNATLDEVPDNLKYKSGLEKALQTVATWVTKGRWIYMGGGFGSGKTASAVVLAKECMLHGGTVYFTTEDELTSHRLARNSIYLGDYTVIDKAAYSNILILDDLGCGIKANDFRTDVVENMLRDRYSRIQSVIFTSNLPFNPDDKQSEFYRVYGAKVVSMIQECADFITFGDYSWRTSNVN